MERIWSIDRFVGELAVCEGEGRVFRELPRAALPKNAREGDCLRERDGVFFLDEEETARRRKKNHDLLRGLLRGE